MLTQLFFKTNPFSTMFTTATSYQKKVDWLIVVALVVKIILSFFIELGNDEVYYYTYAIQPDWNHFDHPGMVGWMMRVTSLNLYWVSALSMRIGSMICAGLATYFIFKIGTVIKDEYAGYIAAWLYTISFYTSIIAGLFVLPDSPQLLFFTLSIYWMVKQVKYNHHFTTKDWIILGVLIGLSTLSKVHGLYLWAGFGAFILFHQTKTLQQAGLYIGVFISVLCVLPIVYWNVQNDFITYQFHSERVMHTGLQLDSFLQQIVGEIIYQNPLVYLSVIIAFFNFKRLKLAFQQQPAMLKLLLWLSIPLIATFWLLSLFNSTLPHWTGPGFIALFIISGVYWSTYTPKEKGLPIIVQYAAGLLVILVTGILLFIYVFPKQIGSTQSANLGEYNPINDLTGWERFTKAFEQIVQKDKAAGIIKPNAPIIVHKWFPAGHLLFYTARPLNMDVIAVGKLEDVHKFAWLNVQTKGLSLGEDAYCIVPSNLPVDPQLLYGTYFEKIVKPDTIAMVTQGVTLRNFYVYRLIHCKKLPEAIIAK